MFDTSLGISEQAWAILRALRYWDFATDSHIHTSAWYNGREKGIVISVCKRGVIQRQTNISFGECRSSDQIFVDKWESPSFNIPDLASFTDEDYQNRKYFKCLEIRTAAEYILSLLEPFVRLKRVEGTKGPV